MTTPDFDYQAEKAKLAEAHQQLRDAAEKASNTLLSDARVLKTILKVGDDVWEQPLWRGTWVPTYTGVELMLVDDATTCHKSDCPILGACCSAEGVSVGVPVGELCQHAACTRVLCKSAGTHAMPQHQHPYHEFVQVIQGLLIVGDISYKPGDSCFFPAHTPHAPYVNGLVLICWQPPLSRFVPADEPLARRAA